MQWSGYLFLSFETQFVCVFFLLKNIHLSSVAKNIYKREIAKKKKKKKTFSSSFYYQNLYVGKVVIDEFGFIFDIFGPNEINIFSRIGISVFSLVSLIHFLRMMN